MLITLETRKWQCGRCNRKHHRDVNAAINILKVGASTFGLEGVGLAVLLEIPTLAINDTSKD